MSDDCLARDLQPDGGEHRWYGLYPALVSDIVDPLARGRVQVVFPGFGAAGKAMRAWATLLSPYAGDDQGMCVLPEVDTQVVVGFEAGDPRRPYIVGACWNGKASPPAPADAANNLRTIKTRSGSRLEFDDTRGAARITLTTAAGHQLVLDEAAQEVSLGHANGLTIRMSASGTLEISALATVELTAPMVQVKAAMATFDGVVQCTNLIATAGVVSPSYSPGVGNLL
jgi:uncharacterized protein involved in type VI secretion and phage assembly